MSGYQQAVFKWQVVLEHYRCIKYSFLVRDKVELPTVLWASIKLRLFSDRAHYRWATLPAIYCIGRYYAVYCSVKRTVDTALLHICTLGADIA